MKIKISPSLLSANAANMIEDIRKVENNVEMLHVDVMDGHFVPNLTFGVPLVKALRGMTDKILDVHLMIDNPSKYIKPFADAGSDIITVHAEAPDDILWCLKEIKAMGKTSGLAINPDTPPSVIEQYLPYVDMVLQMTVFPGFGGQGMVTEAIKNLPVIREMIGDKDLEVDGGIYAENVCELAEKGANVFVSGTGIFKQDNPALAADEIRNNATINEGR